MVRIRLRRVGGKGQPSFRVVAADKESPRDGRFIEVLGLYNPRTEPATIQLKEDRIYEWMSKGAQPSDSVMQVFQTAGLVDRYERFKAGEKVDKLLNEAEEAAKTRNVNPKTRHAAPVGKPKKKAKPKAEAKTKEKEESAKESDTKPEPGAVDEKVSEPADERKADTPQGEKAEEKAEAEKVKDKEAEAKQEKPKAETKTKDEEAVEEPEKKEAEK